MSKRTKPKPLRLIHHKQAKMLLQELIDDNYHLQTIGYRIDIHQRRADDKQDPDWPYSQMRLIETLLLYQYLIHKGLVH